MVLNISERSYGGKKFRPNTLLDFEKSNNLLLCITAWGKENIISRVTESIKSYITLANEDSEVTMLYSRKENLHTMGNTLRMAVIMASEKIYNEFNKEEYTCGFEIFAAVQDGPQWIYVSCGQPSLVIKRKNLGIVPLNQSTDLNVLTQKSSIQDPLPNALLGLGQHPPIQYGNIRLKKSDQLALISRSYLPNSFYKLNNEQFNMEDVALTLAKDNQEVPFWLAFINMD